MEAGPSLVYTRPLTALEFQWFWIYLERYKLLQTEDGRKQLKTRVDMQVAVNFEKLAHSGASSADYGDAMMRAMPPKYIGDPSTANTPWTDPGAMLGLLPDDDPRAAFLRAGGRLDGAGNPVLPPS